MTAAQIVLAHVPTGEAAAIGALEIWRLADIGSAISARRHLEAAAKAGTIARKLVAFRGFNVKHLYYRETWEGK